VHCGKRVHAAAARAITVIAVALDAYITGEVCHHKALTEIADTMVHTLLVPLTVALLVAATAIAAAATMILLVAVSSTHCQSRRGQAGELG
jgi:hypothetical protein